MASTDRGRLFYGPTHELLLDRFHGNALATVLEAGVDYYMSQGTRPLDGDDGYKNDVNELVEHLDIAKQIIAEIETAFPPQFAVIVNPQNLELDLRFGPKRASRIR